MKKTRLFSIAIALFIAFAAFTPVAAGDADPLLMPATLIGAVADGHNQFIPAQCGPVTETETHYYIGPWKILKKYATTVWNGNYYCVTPKYTNFPTYSYYKYTYRYVPEFGWMLWTRQGGG